MDREWDGVDGDGGVFSSLDGCVVILLLQARVVGGALGVIRDLKVIGEGNWDDEDGV